MRSLHTFAFTGTGSAVLQCNFLPEIILDDEYSCALLDLTIENTTATELELGEIRINCDLISNSYINGQQSDVIHQFVTSSTTLKSGQTLFEVPRHLNYFPVKDKILQSIHISIVNNKGKLLNIVGGYIICRIAIKKDTKT